MSSEHRDYFEQAGVWDESYRDSPAERMRVEETLSLVPADTRSLLDVGCGSGEFLRALQASSGHGIERLAGVDRSAEALKQVSIESHRSPMERLPFDDGEFDTLTCLEVLEHVSHASFESATRELERVAGKYILVTVPNQERLADNLVQCPCCRCLSSPWGHVRSFDMNILERLFQEFEMIDGKKIGPIVEKYKYPPVVMAAKVQSSPTPMPKLSLCPQCGYIEKKTGEDLPKRMSVSHRNKALKYAGRILAKKSYRKKWLAALFARRRGSD